MINSWIEISAVLLGTLIFIFLPVICVVADFGLWTLGRYRRATILRCPERGKSARVTVDAMRAVLTSIIGRPCLHVKGCSLWAHRRACTQTCVKASRSVPPSGPY
jgi:hypothetical protein